MSLRIVSRASARGFLCLVSLFAIGACNEPAPDGDATALSKGRQYTQWFYDNQIAQIWEHRSEVFNRALFPDQETLEAFREQVASEQGSERSVIKERVLSIDRMRAYERTALFEGAETPVQIQWIMDASASYGITDVNLRPLPPEAPSDFLSYRTKTQVRLPFDGEWFVLWGGRSIEDNYHVDAPNQRFAYDFMVLDNGRYHSGDGTRNQDYFCFGKAVVAPGSGTVFASAADVSDNTPPVENLEQPYGNFVAIDHGNGEYSFLAHFQQGTVAVRTGEVVTRGQFLGLCGNSGGSDIPHLHYHIQNSPVLDDNVGPQGLPIQFLSYESDGRIMIRQEPVRFQKVRNIIR